ncbi:MAG: pilus assembly protein PilM [Candidatus Omnitrophota bacterium]
MTYACLPAGKQFVKPKMIKFDSLMKTGSQFLAAFLKNAQGFISKVTPFITKITKKFGKKEFVLGIDIGSSSVKIVQFKKLEAGGLLLVYANIVEINQQEGQNAKINALNRALGGIDPKKAKSISVINCPGTFTLELSVPYMSHSELAEAVKWQARKFIPFIAEDTEVDFKIQEEVLDKGAKKFKVLVSISPKKTVTEHLALLNQLGIRPAGFIPVPLALKSLVERLNPPKEETLAVLEMGASITELVIFKGTNPVFNRKIPVTGADFTNSLKTTLASEKGRFELNLEEAEKIKRLAGIPQVAGQELIEGKISASQMLSLIRPVLERLSSQVIQSLDYYYESWSPEKINRLVICGGAAKLKGLAAYLSGELNMKVELSEPLRGINKMEGALKQEAPLELCMALGAALAQEEGINLLPGEFKTQTQRTVKGAAFKATVSAIILILVFIYVGMAIRLNSINKKLQAQDLLLKALTPQFEDAKEQSQIYDIVNNEPLWEDVFKELSNVVCDNLYLTSMGIKPDNIVLTGVILSKGARMEDILSQFMMAIEEGIFKEVNLVSTRKKSEPFESLEFVIKCKAQ